MIFGVIFWSMAVAASATYPPQSADQPQQPPAPPVYPAPAPPPSPPQPPQQPPPQGYPSPPQQGYPTANNPSPPQQGYTAANNAAPPKNQRYPPVSAPVITVENPRYSPQPAPRPPQGPQPAKPTDPKLKEILYILPIIHKIEKATDNLAGNGQNQGSGGIGSSSRGYGPSRNQPAPAPKPQMRYGSMMMQAPLPQIPQSYGRRMTHTNSVQPDGSHRRFNTEPQQQPPQGYGSTMEQVPSPAQPPRRYGHSIMMMQSPQPQQRPQQYGNSIPQPQQRPQQYGNSMPQPQQRPQQYRNSMPQPQQPQPPQRYGSSMMQSQQPQRYGSHNNPSSPNNVMMMMAPPSNRYPNGVSMMNPSNKAAGNSAPGSAVPVGYAHISFPAGSNSMPPTDRGYPHGMMSPAPGAPQSGSNSRYGPSNTASTSQKYFRPFMMSSGGQTGSNGAGSGYQDQNQGSQRPPSGYDDAHVISGGDSETKQTIISVALKPTLSQKGQYPTISYTVISGKDKRQNGGSAMSGAQLPSQYGTSGANDAMPMPGGYGDTSQSTRGGYGSESGGYGQSHVSGISVYDVCEDGFDLDGFCDGKYAGLYGHPNPQCFIQCDQFRHHSSSLCAPGTTWLKSDYEPSSVNQCMHSTNGIRTAH